VAPHAIFGLLGTNGASETTACKTLLISAKLYGISPDGIRPDGRARRIAQALEVMDLAGVAETARQPSFRTV
jgi:hypothetical protein